MQRCVSARVYGKVQGVWFRASTKEEADRLEIVGFVRNEEDGTVFMEAQGDAEAMQQFLDWVHEGPRHAEVRSVDIQEIAPKDYSEFRIS